MCIRTKILQGQKKLEINSLVDQDHLAIRLLSKKWQHCPQEDWNLRLKALELFSPSGQSQRGLFNLATLNLRGVKK